MRIKSQAEILDIGIRKKIIEEINGQENQDRKAKSYKRHMIYKDQTEYWVLEMLERQFDQNTVREMQYAISNISIAKKVVDKLARVYSGGVTRTAVNEMGEKDDDATSKIQTLESELKINQKQKTLNRYLKLHYNAAMYIKPCPDENGIWDIVPTVLAPHLYDVVEDFYDRTKGLVYILSGYKPRTVQYSSQDVSKEGRSFDSQIRPAIGTGTDEVIADSPADSDVEKVYIWWSDDYHFTTDETGSIISETTDNPIGECPIIPYARDQDNNFWAIGGDDLEAASVRLNAQISHINYIGALQGYGIFYYSGKKAPTNMVVGTNKGIKLEYEEGEPVPSIGFASANPQLTSLMQMVEMQLAMLLTTNNLSTSGVSTQLGSNQSFASGVSMLLDKADSMEDVSDQQQIFLDNEPEMWEVINKWIQLYESEGVLDDDLMGLSIPDDLEVLVQFTQPQVIISEQEKLANIEKRKSLGINTQADLIMIDRPNLSEDEAKAKIDEINGDKESRMLNAVKPVTPKVEVMNEDDQDSADVEDDSVGDRPVQ
jgi:hypothetical protein